MQIFEGSYMNRTLPSVEPEVAFVCQVFCNHERIRCKTSTVSLRGDALVFTFQIMCQSPKGPGEVNSLALNLYPELTAQEPSSNVFSTSLSISSAFSYVYIGAGGNMKAGL